MTEQESTPRRRMAFFVDATMHTPNGYVPAVVYEGESGYYPMIGQGELSEPWYWGHDLTKAEQLADEANAKLGLSPEEAKAIIHSSITTQIREDAVRQRVEERWEDIRRGRPRMPH